jgi:hypothetical protein
VPIGQRVVEKYVKHPAAASGYLADGDPLDAGTAHLIHSNLSHLSERNVRLVGHVVGPGEVDWQGAWSGVIDETEISGNLDTYGLIPWYRDRTAKMLGPVALSMARVQAAPAGLVPRKVRVVVQGTKSTQASTTLYVYAVLTATPDSPINSVRYATATASKAAGGSDTVCTFDLTLTPTPVRPSQEWPCREGTAGLGATAAITPAWVWVGWRSTTTAAPSGDPDTIESISVFEVWE